MIKFWNWFTKITGWPVQKLCFRTHIYYEDKKIQGRKLKGPAIIVCNHTSVYDYAALLFVFFSRTVRYQMAEVLFRKKLLGWFLRRLGGIVVDRNSHGYGFISKSGEILRNGGAVGIFPESRLPKKGELPPLEFKPSAAYLALSANVPIVPVYTNGSYFRKKHASVMIGTPVDVSQLYDKDLSEKENLEKISEYLRERVIALGKELSENEKRRNKAK